MGKPAPWRIGLLLVLLGSTLSGRGQNPYVSQLWQVHDDLPHNQVDDVLQLNSGPEDLVTLTVDHVPKFVGFPGIIKGNRAVEIAGLIQNDGGGDSL